MCVWLRRVGGPRRRARGQKRKTLACMLDPMSPRMWYALYTVAVGGGGAGYVCRESSFSHRAEGVSAFRTCVFVSICPRWTEKNTDYSTPRTENFCPKHDEYSTVEHACTSTVGRASSPQQAVFGRVPSSSRSSSRACRSMRSSPSPRCELIPWRGLTAVLALRLGWGYHTRYSTVW